MSFLQPLLLLALPFIGLPILIHLMNQRRYQTVPWAAMHFLQKAKRLNAGMTKLRYWLVMALRMAAVAGVVFGLSRPIASGWLSWLGTNRRPIYVLLDRSPSMELQDSKTRASKRETALKRFDVMYETMQSSGDRYLISTGLDAPRHLEPGETFATLAESAPVAQSSDWVSVFEKTFQSIERNQYGAADIWLCSDLQEHDWKPSSSQWEAIRSLANQHPSVRILGLTYPSKDDTNYSVSVENVQREQKANDQELRLDLRVRQNAGEIQSLKLPVAIHMGETRQVIEVNMQGPEAFVADVRVPIESSPRGAGYVELPSDANSADNIYHFSYSPAQQIVATVVADDDAMRDLITLAITTSYSDDEEIECNSLRTDQSSQIDWSRSSLVCWQGELGNESNQLAMQSYVKRGGTLVLFPPNEQAIANVPLASGPLGISWGAWQIPSAPLQVSNWRTDSDLCRNTESSEAIPLSDLRVSKVIELKADGIVSLAKLANSRREFAPEAPSSIESDHNLLSRIRLGDGVVFVYQTLPHDDYSNLAQDGVCLYIMLQRALHDGLSGPNTGVAFDAGVRLPNDLQEWQAANIASKSVLPWERSLQSGAYRNDDRIITINRSLEEDSSPLMEESQWRETLSGMPLSTVLDDPSRN